MGLPEEGLEIEFFSVSEKEFNVHTVRRILSDGGNIY